MEKCGHCRYHPACLRAKWIPEIKTNSGVVVTSRRALPQTPRSLVHCLPQSCTRHRRLPRSTRTIICLDNLLNATSSIQIRIRHTSRILPRTKKRTFHLRHASWRYMCETHWVQCVAGVVGMGMVVEVVGEQARQGGSSYQSYQRSGHCREGYRESAGCYSFCRTPSHAHQLDYGDGATRIENTVDQVIREGRHLTPDLGGASSTSEVVEEVARGELISIVELMANHEPFNN